MAGRPTYNERSWAADLISEINRLSATCSRTVQRAGGEWSLSSQSAGKVLFPDVLLFGDASQSVVLQGWELKMPDTAVTEVNLLKNAQEKANRLGLPSYLVWNAVDAVLYVRTGDTWTVEKTWRCEGIRSRRDVQTNRTAWEKTLAIIVGDLNDYFEQGRFSSQKPLPAQLNDVVAAILDSCRGYLEMRLKQESARSKVFRSEVSVWWRSVRAEHGNPKDDVRFSFLATELLLHWLHRFLFAHYLKRFVSEAWCIDKLSESSEPKDAERIFLAISAKRDFAQVFCARLGSEFLPTQVWHGLLAFNDFLKAVRIPALDQKLFQETMQAVREESQRKIAGQFCTPPPLAELLVKLTLDNLNAPVLDPCCGTGTIARAVYDLKIQGGVLAVEAVRTTWASDRYAMPLQFATLALASGETPFETLRVFEHDVTTLKSGESVSFTDANTGKPFTEVLPRFPCIVINPPFVRFEDWMKDEPSVAEINDYVAAVAGERIDSKADYFVPIILHLSRLVSDDGRVGAIFSNAWLGADWGLAFRRILQKFYIVEAVLTSGAGRWFQNADVVTNLVILKRRKTVGHVEHDELTAFGVVRHPLSAWTSDETNVIAETLAPTSDANHEIVRVNRVTAGALGHFDAMGLCWSAHFTNLDWFSRVQPFLKPISTEFEVQRGERRGWDPLFFPPDDAPIEPKYLRPVLHSAVDVHRLCAAAGGRAFCCSCSCAELQKREHVGALSWIERFASARNGKGKPLPEVLGRSGLKWYEMRPDTTADMAVSMNPDKRLFFMRLKPRAFVNQRLIRLTAKTTSVDIDLAHAMLCSLLGCFYLEALGFGRGLGVLDLNATKLARQMRMFDLGLVAKKDRETILTAFRILQRRNVLSFEAEMMSSDRMAFENTVFSSFGVADVLPQVQESVLELHRIRGAACKQKVREDES